MGLSNSSILNSADLRFSAPEEYARTLRAAHEATISGAPDPRLPPSLIKSWQRSLALGINPDQHRPVHRHEVSEARSLSAGHRLAAVMPALSQLLADETATGRHLLIVTDHVGEVLWRIGSRQALRLADSLEFVEGADWSESGVGTNAISEALVTGVPAQLFSAEHLVRTHHDWACTASPIRDPLTGDVLGVLDVSGPFESVTPDSLRLVRCGVRLAEELLKSATPPAGPDRDAGSTLALKLRLLGDAPSAALDGDTLRPLTLRRAEILALLASRTQGWSADELAYEIHGDAGTAAAIRTEMHRIRSLLGNVVEANPYRFAAGVTVDSDAARVARHLRAGRVAAAFAAYPARFLNRSANLAIGFLRDELNEAVGASVRASGDARLMLQWCLSDMGSVDTAAAAAAAKLMGPDDPRGQLVNARMERIDRELRA
ncbi:transcriptional regulator [Arthrobacter sp. AL08]|uniref:GAF domain-containing protein n=1 Tax=unclassified Arthrobacter TaxID=235627 RepID=UPI00249C55F3|nr:MULTISPECIES: GAF domain-containing protein [unclassified Arthrobacter]MDI3242165.1 transcriptional regulator [Arthrobacter sp. AL05]MDI3278230.1 transcriptional regulator [Arthrobacter sp. AL08]